MIETQLLTVWNFEFVSLVLICYLIFVFCYLIK